MCQVCCRHRRSWPSNPLCHYFSWWASCWKILFLLRSYLDCICCALSSSAFWYHKSSHPIFPFNSLSPFICPNNYCGPSFLFLMVLSRNLSYPTISIISSFDIFSVHDILFPCTTFTSIHDQTVLDNTYFKLNQPNCVVASFSGAIHVWFMLAPDVIRGIIKGLSGCLVWYLFRYTRLSFIIASQMTYPGRITLLFDVV